MSDPWEEIADRVAEIIEDASPAELGAVSGKLQALSILLGVAAGLSQEEYRALRDKSFDRDWLGACAALTPGARS